MMILRNHEKNALFEQLLCEKGIINCKSKKRDGFGIAFDKDKIWCCITNTSDVLKEKTVNDFSTSNYACSFTEKSFH